MTKGKEREEKAKQALKEIGALPDAAVPLVRTALLLSSLARPDLVLAPYLAHVETLGQDVALRHAALLEAGAVDGAALRLAALKNVLSDQHGYGGDQEQYDDPRNADLAQVIDRRKGLPVVLCLLSLHVGREQGWALDGLNFPGHFLARIEQEGTRILFDPFHGFVQLEAQDLRGLLKKVAGKEAELSAAHWEAAPNREILLRMQNNIKRRQIERRDYAQALKTAEEMRLFAPRDARLWLDCGVLCARLGQTDRAIAFLEDYARSAAAPDRREVEALLRHLYNQ